ncbi:hypothetical protein ACFLQJ_01700 [Calditrichota bacterium]
MTSFELALFPQESWLGNPGLMTTPLCAILNSRQSKYPHGADKWVENTVKAVFQAVQNGYTILTSTGMKTWELVLWAATESLGNVVILTGINQKESRLRLQENLHTIIHDFNLNQADCLFIPYDETGAGLKSKESWHLRDDWIIHTAGKLMPVAIRKDGFMSSRIQEASTSDKCDFSFKIQYRANKHVFPSVPEKEEVRHALSKIIWNHAVHWTRSNSEPWIGEKKSDFYSALVNSGTEYCRSAHATVMKILEDGCIRGTTWHMPGSKPMVSFSALRPYDFLPMMKWRKRYVRREFEPYGIAVRKDLLQKLGAQPVAYGERSVLKSINSRERLFFQTVNPDGEDWSREEEWRLLGDFEFDSVDLNDLIIFVLDHNEVEKVKEKFDGNVIPLSLSPEFLNN